jgi:ADP-heptose:LPS heptosyltransferase
LKKFLIIQTASVGDVILATPVAEKIHRSIPDSSIDLLVKKGNESLFANHPYLNEVLTWDKSHHKYGNLQKLIVTLRANHYDIVINIQRFFSTGLLTALSGGRTSIGFAKNPLSVFFTRRIKHMIAEGTHEVDRNLMLIENIPGPEDRRPALYPSAGDLERTASYRQGRYYTISPASLWFTKQFPAEKWIGFLKLPGMKGKVYFLGSKSDRALCDEIIRSSGYPDAVNLAGELSFLESAALMKDARMNFTNDSAPMHLASAVNAAVTVIYCSTIPGFGFGPLSEDSAVIEIKEKLYCRPCGLHGLRQCPEKHFKCALMIDPADLARKL